MGPTNLFVDMNAYFASVEQQERPELRNRPTAVVPTLADTTCCIAVSYEAKRYGIKTGTLVGEARRLCPSLLLIEARPDVYVRYHHAIAAAIESCTPVQQICSIDEFSCRLIGAETEPQRALALARRIKETLRRDIGEYVRCSIGLAPNRLLAKVAADMQKPDGLVLLRRDELPEKLYGLELIDLPGIGPRMNERLRRHGIETVRQLCALSEDRLRVIWKSVLGAQWWYHLRGYDLRDRPTHRRTVGHSHVLPPKWRNRQDAQAVLVRLIHRAAARLRNLGYWARHMTVYVRYLPRAEWHAQICLGTCQDTVTMVEALAGRWKYSPQGTPFQVGVTLYNLVADGGSTLPLFADERGRVRLAAAMDFLNARYGAHTICLGGMWTVRDLSPPRIAFTHIPRLDPTEI